MSKKEDCYVRYLAGPIRKQSLFFHLGFSSLAQAADVSFLEAKNGRPDVVVIDENTLLQTNKKSPLSEIDSIKEAHPQTAIILLSKKYTEPETEMNEENKADFISYMAGGVDKILPWSRNHENLRAITHSILQAHQFSGRLRPERENTFERHTIKGIEIVPERYEVRFGPVIINNLDRRTMALLLHFSKSTRTKHDHHSIRQGIINTCPDLDPETIDVGSSVKRLKQTLTNHGLPPVLKSGHENHGLETYDLDQ